jgi:hypothetical protein
MTSRSRGTSSTAWSVLPGAVALIWVAGSGSRSKIALKFWRFLFMFVEMRFLTFFLVKRKYYFNCLLWSKTSKGPKLEIFGSIPASVGTVESEGRQMKQCWIKYEKNKKSPKKIFKKKIFGSGVLHKSDLYG